MALNRSTSLEDSKIVTGRTKLEMTGADITSKPLTHKEAMMKVAGAEKENTTGKKASKKKLAKRGK